VQPLSGYYRYKDYRWAMIHGGPMNMHAGDIDLAVSCAFCQKRLAMLNGDLQAWRSPNGQFFCDEFCSDDYDEARFRRRSSVSASPMQDIGGSTPGQSD
jgi:hypothetical protein